MSSKLTVGKILTCYESKTIRIKSNSKARWTGETILVLDGLSSEDVTKEYELVSKMREELYND